MVAYETHRGFKALAFYLLLRSLTTSSGVYREINQKYLTKGTRDGREAWSRFNARIASQIGMSFNSVASAARLAEQFGFISITARGYQFTGLEAIVKKYDVLRPGQELEFTTIEVDPKHDSLEHILKTLVIGENFDRQAHALSKKIDRIPGVKERLAHYIPNWKRMSLKKLCDQVVMWQKRTFETYSKGTEGYDLMHSIHADIAISCRGLANQFAFKAFQSAAYLKTAMKGMGLISVTKREVIGVATRLPHEPNGECKPIKTVWLKTQQKRKWSQPDGITLNFLTA